MFTLVIATGFLIFVGIVGVKAFYSENLPATEKMILQAVTASSTTSQLAPTPLTATPSLIPTNAVSLPGSGAIPGLYAFIRAPKGIVSSPYVVLDAFSFELQSVGFKGLLNTQDFVCEASPCLITLQDSSRVIFAAVDDSGNTSDDIIASVNVTQLAGGYQVTIAQVSQFTLFRDSCSIAWGIRDEEGLTWDDFVQFPYELNTRKTLHRLSTKLILHGIVDASACPFGGLSLGLDWPTACGLDASFRKAIEWQNQYDPAIWLASRDHGIPPKILKSLLEIETQYWPENSRFYVDEFGLGQINQLGVDVLLRNDFGFYQSICKDVFTDCSTPYLSLSSGQQALIRGAAVRLADVSCESCPYGIDVTKSQSSISLIARLLKANCEQVNSILKDSSIKFADPDVYAATATASAATAVAGGVVEESTSAYEDLWRFTLASYHSGLSCFREAVIATKNENLPVTWENVSKQFKCKSGVSYADGFMNVLESFDLYLYQPGEDEIPYVVPAFSPTRTPIPTSTSYVSSARIKVLVFLDRNGNNSPDLDEWIDAMTVQVTTSDNQNIILRTQNGVAVFDMSNFKPGIGINVSLPGLYRNQTLVLPAQGEVTITFKFDIPALPTNLP